MDVQLAIHPPAEPGACRPRGHPSSRAFIQNAPQHVGHEAVMPQRAVVGAQMQFQSEPAKFVEPRKELGISGAVAKRHPSWPRYLAWHFAVRFEPEQFGAQRQERRLPDAAGHDDDMFGRWRRETVSQRAPNVQQRAGAAIRQVAA